MKRDTWVTVEKNKHIKICNYVGTHVHNIDKVGSVIWKVISEVICIFTRKICMIYVHTCIYICTIRRYVGLNSSFRAGFYQGLALCCVISVMSIKMFSVEKIKMYSSDILVFDLATDYIRVVFYILFVNVFTHLNMYIYSLKCNYKCAYTFEPARVWGLPVQRWYFICVDKANFLPGVTYI